MILTPRQLIHEMEQRDLADCSILFSLLGFASLMVVIALAAVIYGFTKSSLPYLCLLPVVLWIVAGIYLVYLLRIASRSWSNKPASTFIFHVMQYVTIVFAVFQCLIDRNFAALYVVNCIMEVVLLFFYGTYFLHSLVLWRRPPFSAIIGFLLVVASAFISFARA